VNFEEALVLLNDWLVEKTGKRLTMIEIEILRGTLEGKTYDEMEISGYASGYIRMKIAPDLWKRLSMLIGGQRLVTKKNMQFVLMSELEKRSLSSPLQQFDLESQKQLKPPSYIDWGESPDIISIFYAREKELATLEQWIIRDQCRVIEIAGIGGIGKTALVKELATQIQDQFEFIIWRSLFSSPPIKNILTELIEFFSQQQEPNLPQDSSSLISKLIEYLRSHRCLLILDNLETILQPGELAGSYRQGYEDYGYLIKQVGETLHQSCLIITSREQLREIALRQEGSSPVRSLILQGLDKNAAMQILSNRGLLDQEQWGALIDLCNGNPLALQLATGTIKWVFGGYVSNFLEMEAFTFNFDGFLDRQFERLSSLEKQIMSVLAMTSNAITIKELQEQLQPKVSPSELLKAIQSLLMRSLITRLMNEKEPFFTLHPLLKKYIKDRD
jgi:hypothetical protein